MTEPDTARVDGDLGEANRGVGQQIVGDDGAPRPEPDPAVGGPGTGVGQVDRPAVDNGDPGRP